MADEKVEYQRCSRVSDDEESSTSFLTENCDKYLTSLRQENHLRNLASRGYLILLHVILLATYILIAIKYLQPARKETRYDGFFTPTDAPIFYEQKPIRTPFSFANNTFLDSYAGSSLDIDKKWDEILDVGIIRLTEEEANRLPQKTAKLYGGKEGEYAGFLEMFHQLHCLNRLRKHFYDPTARLDGDEPESFTRNHDEHCFDYIRRNLMCYSDVSILPIGWDTKDEAYYATFDTTVQKTCRNFDAIYEWAKGRQAPWTPPGNGGIDLHISNE